MTEREQLAKNNAMSIEFVNWFFDKKKEGCGNAWFVMMAAMWEGWKAVIDQRDQLGAEAAYLRGEIKQHSQSTHFCEVCGKDDPCITDDVCMALENTPATDAWQREQLRAGVAPQKPILSQAITDIIAERQRQKEKKGYTESRDDNYLPGVLNLAGAAYAVSVSYIPDAKRRADRLWPWPDAGKYLNASSKDPRSALIKAAALITAEIERIDRAQLRNGEAV